MKKKTNGLSTEQKEVFQMIANVCPPVVNKLLFKVSAFRQVLQKSTELMNQINDFAGNKEK